MRYYRAQRSWIFVLAKLPVIVFLLNYASNLAAQESGISANRAINWEGQAGIPGGVPNYTIVCSSIDVGLGDGVTDATSAIQAAINSCPEGQVVLIPAGVFRTTSALTIPKSVVLRGSGVGKTTLIGAISISRSAAYFFDFKVLSGAIRGSTKFVLDSVKGIQVKDYLSITGTDDPEIVNRIGSEPGHLWPTALGQTLQVTNVVGNEVSFSPALFWDLDKSGTPSGRINKSLSYPKQNYIEGAGLEGFTLKHDTSTSFPGYAITLQNAAKSWVKDVEIVGSKVAAIRLIRTYRCEVRDSLIHDSVMYGQGGGYGVLVEGFSTGILIENNIIYHHAGSILIDDGSSGNVIAYNFVGPGQYVQPNWEMPSYGIHSPHPMFNLWEGNVGASFIADHVFGSSSHQTLFRNRFNGWVSETVTRQNFAVGLDSWSRFTNIVGNVLGTAEKSNVYEINPDSVFDPYSKAIFVLGLFGGDLGNDPLVKQSLFRHGNFDYVTKSTKWDLNIGPSVLPASVYLKAKPAWWGQLFWPAFGPDPTEVTKILDGKIPAQQRFENLSNIKTPTAPSRLKIGN